MEAWPVMAVVFWNLFKPENKGNLFLCWYGQVKFKKTSDQLVMTATFVKRRGTIAVVVAKAEVDGVCKSKRYSDLLLETRRFSSFRRL